jgi:hypothetical protein
MWLFLMVASVLAGGSPYLFDGETQWVAALVSRDFIIFCISLSALLLIPYSRPAAKLIWTIWTIWQFIILLTKAAEVSTDLPVQFWSGISWATTAIFALWIFSRKTHEPRLHQFIDGHIYYILATPHDLKSLLLCLFVRPYNGLKVYLDGKLWTYRKGAFTELRGDLAMKRLKNCRVIHLKQASDNDREYLSKLTGLRWSLKNNCYTLLENQFGPVRSYI